MSIRTHFYHCVKSARIRSFNGLYFLAFALNTRDTPDRISSNKRRVSNKRRTSQFQNLICNGGLRPSTLLKKGLWHNCFLVNFVKPLRTPFFKSTSGACFCKQQYQNLIKRMAQKWGFVEHYIKLLTKSYKKAFRSELHYHPNKSILV